MPKPQRPARSSRDSAAISDMLASCATRWLAASGTRRRARHGCGSNFERGRPMPAPLLFLGGRPEGTRCCARRVPQARASVCRRRVRTALIGAILDDQTRSRRRPIGAVGEGSRAAFRLACRRALAGGKGPRARKSGVSDCVTERSEQFSWTNVAVARGAPSHLSGPPCTQGPTPTRLPSLDLRALPPRPRCCRICRSVVKSLTDL